MMLIISILALIGVFGSASKPQRSGSAKPPGRERRHDAHSLLAIIQSIASTLYWIGPYVGIRALPGEKSRRLRWTVGSAAVLVIWLVGVMLLTANDVFRIDAPASPLRC